jgi:hypothetical protein
MGYCGLIDHDPLDPKDSGSFGEFGYISAQSVTKLKHNQSDASLKALVLHILDWLVNLDANCVRTQNPRQIVG